MIFELTAITSNLPALNSMIFGVETIHTRLANIVYMVSQITTFNILFLELLLLFSYTFCFSHIIILMWLTQALE